jgi:hypothetical protein
MADNEIVKKYLAYEGEIKDLKNKNRNLNAEVYSLSE